MKLGEAIEKCEEDNPNALGSETLTDIVNELEGRVLTEVIETFVPIVIDITDNTIDTYDLGEVTLFDIVKVTIGNVILDQVDARESTYGYYLTENGTSLDITLNYVIAGELRVIKQIRASKLIYDNDKNKALIIPFPYDDLYPLYLSANVYKKNKEYDDYNNFINLFNIRYTEFKIWYNKRKPKEKSYHRNVW